MGKQDLDEMTLLQPIDWEQYFYNPDEGTTGEELTYENSGH